MYKPVILLTGFYDKLSLLKNKIGWSVSSLKSRSRSQNRLSAFEIRATAADCVKFRIAKDRGTRSSNLKDHSLNIILQNLRKFRKTY